MLGAFLTTLLFSFSVIFASRSIRALGAMHANLARLILAALVLGAFAHTFGNGLHGAGRNWFFLSGLIGMGLGDLALYGALPRIGPRLSILMTQCLAAPIAAFAEWLWLGAALTAHQALASAVILTGVALALAPGKPEKTPSARAAESTATSRSTDARENAPSTAPALNAAPISVAPASSSAHAPPVSATLWLGLFFGFLSAAGQGIGAVVSRKANLAATLAGETTAGPVLGITAAYQRILGGLAITVVWFAVKALLEKRASALISTASSPASSATAPSTPSPRTWRSYVWVAPNAFSGAILGVSCYQWALATTPSGIVLPIVACTPLAIIPLTYWLDGERPTRRSLLGAVIAVAGVIGLASAR